MPLFLTPAYYLTHVNERICKSSFKILTIFSISDGDSCSGIENTRFSTCPLSVTIIATAESELTGTIEKRLHDVFPHQDQQISMYKLSIPTKLWRIF